MCVCGGGTAAFRANFAIPSPYVSASPGWGDLVQLLLQLCVYAQGGGEGKIKTPQKQKQQVKEASSAIMAPLKQPIAWTYKEH